MGALRSSLTVRQHSRASRDESFCCIHFDCNLLVAAGNLVQYGGGVDFGLWTAQVLAPGPRWVTGSKPDGTPSYASYDPTGEACSAVTRHACAYAQGHLVLWWNTHASALCWRLRLCLWVGLWRVASRFSFERLP